MKVPIKLEKDPIVECVFEFRFTPKINNAGDILLGILYPSLRDELPRVTSLPTQNIPREIREQSADLAFQPTQMFEGNNDRVMLGDRLLLISFLRPYPGWAKVKPRIMKLFELLQTSNMVERFDRLSLKYSNILNTRDNVHDVGQTRAEVKLGQLQHNEAGLQVRAEIGVNKSVFILTLHTGARADIKTGEKIESMTGVLVEVDGVRQIAEGELPGAAEKIIDELHSDEKSVFFSFLNEETIEALGPIYADK